MRAVLCSNTASWSRDAKLACALCGNQTHPHYVQRVFWVKSMAAFKRHLEQLILRIYE